MKVCLIIISAALLVFNFLLLKKRLLGFQHGILWTALYLLSIYITSNSNLTRFLYNIVLLMLLVVLLYLMTAISSIERRLSRLIQENALLKYDMNKR